MLLASQVKADNVQFALSEEEESEEFNDQPDGEVAATYASLLQQPSPSLTTSPRSRASSGRTARFGTAATIARANTNQPTYMVADTSGGGCGGLFIQGELVASLSHPTFACSRLNIAENNSPLVQDRAYFSYRHFHNASEVEVFSNTPGGGIGSQNIDRYTFGMEKTIFDRSSIEFRLPINSQLNSDLFFAQFANEQTVLPLRDYAVELGNVSLILKRMLFESPDFSLSHGAALNCPTAPPVRIRGVIDDPNFIIRDPETGGELARADVDLSLNGIVRNQTFNLSPFLGYYWKPAERWFMQGFVQIDIPLNESDGALDMSFRADDGMGSIFFPFPISETDRLAQQTLLRLNWGIGRWLLDEPEAPYLNQFGLMFEAHYTTTLNRAKLIGPFEVIPDGDDLFDPVSLTVGNINNRVDVLNLVLAVPTRVGQTTLTHGFVAPVRGGMDRGFDFEYNCVLVRSL